MKNRGWKIRFFVGGENRIIILSLLHEGKHTVLCRGRVALGNWSFSFELLDFENGGIDLNYPLNLREDATWGKKSILKMNVVTFEESKITDN